MLASLRKPIFALFLLGISSLGSTTIACSGFRQVELDDAGSTDDASPDDPDGATSGTDASSGSDASGRPDARAGDGAACVPSCGPGRCGDNGCGGVCPTCLGSTKTICTDAGQCCTPFCGTQDCGDDGCGGSCGTCPSLYTCVVHGTCQKDPGSLCGTVTCGSAASCCHCSGNPICFALSSGETCEGLGAGCN
jgi:hypothetical protein